MLNVHLITARIMLQPMSEACHYFIDKSSAQRPCQFTDSYNSCTYNYKASQGYHYKHIEYALAFLILFRIGWKECIDWSYLMISCTRQFLESLCVGQSTTISFVSNYQKDRCSNQCVTKLSNKWCHWKSVNVPCFLHRMV